MSDVSKRRYDCHYELDCPDMCVMNVPKETVLELHSTREGLEEELDALEIDDTIDIDDGYFTIQRIE